jgi:predicted glycosyltransferase
MKYLITIEHPAWAHQFKSIIKKLIASGHQVKTLVINQEMTAELLDLFNIEYTLIGTSTGKNIFDKAWILVQTTLAVLFQAIKFKPNYFIGRATPMVAITAFILRKPHIIFEDTEKSTVSLFFCKRFSKMILTPSSFKNNLGEVHLKIDSYKELFYINKESFQPNQEVLQELGLKKDEPFVLIRFIAWNASHDFGEHGFSKETKNKLVNDLSKKTKVFISSEEKLPIELEQYKLNIAVDKIHSVLYYANLFVSESGTMSTEACVLGTPTVYIATIAKKLGNFVELKEKYNILNFYDSEEDGVKKIYEILDDKDFKRNHQYKLKKLLDDKVDVFSFYLWLITNWPSSKKQIENYKIINCEVLNSIQHFK